MNIYIKLLCNLALLVSTAVSAATPDFYAGFHNLPPSVNLYHYKVPDAILRAEYEASMNKTKQEAKKTKKSVTTTFIVLPQLYVFNKEGREILVRTETSNDLEKLLNHALVTSAPVRNGKPLGSWLKELVPDGKPPAVPPARMGKLTLLEYWAPWCTFCFAERDQLLAYFKRHKNIAVNWITVNADIAKAAGFKVSSH